MQETPFQFLGLEDPLEKGWATHSSILEASLVAQMVKHLSAMQETWVQSLDWDDPLEKEMTAHSSSLARKIAWMEETGR